MTNINKAIVVVLAVILVLGSFYLVISRNNSNSSTNNQTSTSTQTNTRTTPPTSSGVVYRNTEYGFSFSLPKSWEDYTIIEDVWEGDTINNRGERVQASITGPMISIRHPDWDYKAPRQDVPIMVFTYDEWRDLQTDNFHIGAAPVKPTELGRNTKYIFGLPARYNYAFMTGYEEVDKLISNGSFKAF